MAISTRSRSGPSSTTTASSASNAPSARRTISKKTSSTKAAVRRTSPSASSSPSSALPLPDITLLCDDGRPRALHSLLSASHPGMILFTYPRANTGGCTAQARGLSALAAQSKAAGYITVGASYDSVKSQASWKAKYAMSDVCFLCDTLDVGLLKKLGAHKAPKSVKRSVFIAKRSANDVVNVVEKKIVISPKDCIAFVEEYVKQHPCVGVSDDGGAEQQMDENEKDERKDEPGNENENEDEDEDNGTSESNHNKASVEDNVLKGKDKEQQKDVTDSKASPETIKTDTDRRDD